MAQRVYEAPGFKQDWAGPMPYEYREVSAGTRGSIGEGATMRLWLAYDHDGDVGPKRRWLVIIDRHRRTYRNGELLTLIRRGEVMCLTFPLATQLINGIDGIKARQRSYGYPDWRARMKPKATSSAQLGFFRRKVK